MGDLAANALPGVSHRPAHPVDRVPGDKALEPGNFPAGFLIAQAEVGQGERKDTVPFVQELRICPPGR